MRKILFFFILFYVAGNAQVSQRCPVCPPSLNGVPSGYVLGHSGLNAVWVAGGIGSLTNGSGLTFSTDHYNLGGPLTENAIISNYPYYFAVGDTTDIGVSNPTGNLFYIDSQYILLNAKAAFVARSNYAGVFTAPAMEITASNTLALNAGLLNITLANDLNITGHNNSSINIDSFLNVTAGGVNVTAGGDVVIYSGSQNLNGQYCALGMLPGSGSCGLNTIDTVCANGSYSVFVGPQNNTVGTKRGTNIFVGVSDSLKQGHPERDGSVFYNEYDTVTKRFRAFVDVTKKAGFGINPTHIEVDQDSISNSVSNWDVTKRTITLTSGYWKYQTNTGVKLFQDSSGLAQIAGSFIPTIDSAFNLGTPLLRWKDLYLTSGTLHLGGYDLKANGTGLLMPGGLTVLGNVTTTFGGDITGSNAGNLTVTKINGTAAATYVQNQLAALQTFTTPALAATALGSGKPYILSTTIGIVAVLINAITP